MTNLLFKEVKIFLLKISPILFLVLNLFSPVIGNCADKLIIKDPLNKTRLLITEQGKIGIDTLTPNQKIDLGNGGITTDGSDLSGDGITPPMLTQRGPGRIDLGWDGDGGGNLEAYSSGHPTIAGGFNFVFGGGNFGRIRFIHYDGSKWNHRVVITKEGFLGIGAMYPTHPIQLASGAHVTTGGVWVNASSRELKENIKEVSAEEAVATLVKLEPVQYNYKADKKEQYVGFIAEDVPDMVAVNDRKGLSAMDITAVLTKVVQEQQKTIAELQERLAEVEIAMQFKKDKNLALTMLQK